LTFDVLKLLEREGYIQEGEDNLLHAEKAFFAARVMLWIRNKAATEPDFNLTAYLTMLMYYKTGMADLKFSEDGSKLSYRMINNDKEVQELVDSLVKSSRKGATKKLIDTIEESGDSDATESSDRDPKS
jgi:hypothetical protein